MIDHDSSQRLQPLHGVIDASGAFLRGPAVQSVALVVADGFLLSASNRYNVRLAES